MRPQPGDLINGKYRLIRLIGDGGMGSVFEARHEYLGTVVALKFLHMELASRPGLVARFLREARLSASIKSDHIARVTDVDQGSDGAAYLVMELLEGESLRTLLDREGRLSPKVALDYTLQMLDGLEAAHAIGVVHRDLKPENVFIVTTAKGPLVKLLDFGIAKLRSSKELQGGLTRPGVMMGTPEYMAPEQAYAADSVDVRADVFSVGAILYEMLSGKRPAEGDDPLEIAAFIMAQKVPRLSQVEQTIPDPLADVVHRAMAPMPADRFTTVGELRSALTSASGSLPPATRSPRESGVPATLPPDAGAPTPKGERQGAEAGRRASATTQAGAPLVARGATPNFTPTYALPPPPGGDPSYLPGIPRPGAYTNLPPIAGNTKGPRRLSMWLLIGTSVLAMGIVAAALAMGELDAMDGAPAATATGTATAHPIPSGPASPPAATPTGASPTSIPTIAPPVQPTTAPVPATPATKPKPTPAVDASPPAPDAAPPGPIPGFPGLPFPLPSTLPIPPIPIPLPSGFPPFNLPGFPGAPPPAPAPSQ